MSSGATSVRVTQIFSNSRSFGVLSAASSRIAVRPMHEIVDIPVASLLFDTQNARYADEPSSQQAAAIELAEKHGEHIVELAADIVAEGATDPLALPAVVPSGDTRKRYTLLEGNRRLLAVRALETPTLISSVLSPAAAKKLSELSKGYVRQPITHFKCALFDSEQSARHWIFLRHTGQNEGAGLVTWGSTEKDRFQARHSGKLKPAGQVIAFVEAHGALSAAAKASGRGIQTNVERLVETTDVRKRLGIDVVDGDVVSLYPLEEVVKGLTRIVEDLKTQAMTVPQLYHAHQRRDYVNSFGRKDLPKKTTMLRDPVVLSDLTSGQKKPRTIKKKRGGSASKPPTARTTVISGTATPLNVTTPRINAIYIELLTISAEQYPNACSVLLRVFIELSVDHALDARKLMTESNMRNTPLAKRLKAVAADLKSRRRISAKLAAAVDSIANGPSVLAPGVPTFNQYVHNQFVFPKPSDLYAAWDELSPFMEKVWP